MKHIRLGTTDLEIAKVCLGGNVFGWTLDKKDSFHILNEAFEMGLQFIDTADSYSTWVPGNKGGESEAIIGSWMKEKKNRADVVIATKVGGDMKRGKKDLSKAWIMEEVEQSLKRLNTDYIDLYQSHWDDEITPVEETMEAYHQLIRQGKVRFIGASNLSLERIEQSNEYASNKQQDFYRTLQPYYNLYSRKGFEENYREYCEENEIAVLPYYSLESGFLTGKYRTENDIYKSPRGQIMSKYFNERGFNILTALEKIGENYNVPMASVALAWLIKQKSVGAAIASATKENHLEDMIKAINLQLSDEDIIMLGQASAY